MGTACKIKIDNVMYYKHYDGWEGGLTLILLECIVNNKICLDTFIKKGNLEISDKPKNNLPFFNVSDTLINNIDIYDFMIEGLNSIVRAEQRLYEHIKQDDNRMKYFSELRGESPEVIESKFRLNKIFKNRYPTREYYQEKYNIIERLKNV